MRAYFPVMPGAQQGGHTDEDGLRGEQRQREAGDGTVTRAAGAFQPPQHRRRRRVQVAERVPLGLQARRGADDPVQHGPPVTDGQHHLADLQLGRFGDGDQSHHRAGPNPGPHAAAARPQAGRMPPRQQVGGQFRGQDGCHSRVVVVSTPRTLVPPAQ